MRMHNLAVGAALLILAAGPALAGEPGGGHPGGGHPGGGCRGSCGGGHPGGGHPPGGGNTNINVNVNAGASAGASARGSLNARTYDVGGIRGGGGSYGAVYTGGGYGGDGGYYYGGGAVYGEVDESRICASAPFGYVVTGFGREGRRAPTCLVGSGGGGGCDRDRGGRYGYSEPHGCGESVRRRPEVRYEETGSYEYREEYSAYSEGYHAVDYGSGRCGCDHDDHDAAPYPPRYAREPEPNHRPARPHRPRPEYPSRPSYSPSYRQEPGERG